MANLRGLFAMNFNKSNSKNYNIKIVSGGQTGVDRAALDVAIELGLEHGGWCPKGRKAEDGTIPEKYQMMETESDEYSERTKLNIRDSDGTLIIVPYKADEATGGTLQTIQVAKEINKPCYVLDVSENAEENAFSNVINWMKDNNIQLLNVAGPRESQSSGIYKKASNFLTRLCSYIDKDENVLVKTNNNLNHY